MLTTIGLDTVLTQPCPSCAVVHQLRVVTTEESTDLEASMCGFFSRCPNTGERVWLVAKRPEGLAGRMWRFGPPDQLEWEPSYDVLAAAPASASLPAAVNPPAPVPSRCRAKSAVTPLLRLAWGCPY